MFKERYPEGKPIFLYGEKAEKAYFVDKGVVRIERKDKRGNVEVVAYVGEGEIFGEYALVARNDPEDPCNELKQERSASAFADCDCVLEVVTRIEFEDKLRGLDPFFRHWIEVLIKRTLPKKIDGDATPSDRI